MRCLPWPQAAEIRRTSWEGAQRALQGELRPAGPRIHDPGGEAARDRGLRFLRAAEGPARPTRARRGHLPADRVAAFVPEPLSTVQHTLAKGAERGAHPARRVLLLEDLDAEGDGREFRLSLAPVAR